MSKKLNIKLAKSKGIIWGYFYSISTYYVVVLLSIICYKSCSFCAIKEDEAF